MSKQPWLRCFLELFKADISREHAKDFDVAKSAISNHQSTIGNGTWAVKVSNLRPSRCKRDALPLS